MIKKILLISLILLMVFAPCALANDGGPWLDTQRVTYSCTIIEDEIAIGEKVTVNLKATNNTPAEVRIYKLHTIFEDCFDTDELGLDYAVIQPHETVEISYKYTVPAGIKWYEQSGEYYTNIAPILDYDATPYLQSENGKWEDYANKTYVEFYSQELKTLTPVKITNLQGGSHLAEVLLLDDKSIIGYNDSAYKPEKTYAGQLQACLSAYLSLENLSPDPLVDIHVITDYVLDIDAQIRNGETAIFTKDTYFSLYENKIPNQQTIEYKVLFKQYDSYFCTSVSREYNTQVIDVPDLQLREIEIEADNEMGVLYTYLVENNTGADIEGLTIFINNRNRPPIDSMEFQQNGMFLHLKDNDAYQLPITCEMHDGFYVFVGFVIDGQYYHTYMSVSAGHTLPSNGVELIHLGYNQDQIMDLYYLFEDIDTNYPSPLPTATHAPTAEPTPSPEPTIAPTVVPISPTPQIEIVEVEKYYIPKWVWLALVTTVSLIFILVAYIITKSNKTL